MPIVGITAARTRSVKNGERAPDDFYRTPARATEALLSVEKFEGPIWEPACGDGAISTVLEQAGYDVLSTDLVDRGYGTPRRDFLLETMPATSTIITNPPFKLADQFARHSMGWLSAKKLALFCRLAWLEGADRHRTIFSVHPPIRVWVFSRRLTLWRGDKEPKDKGGAVAFAWYVWERGYTGAPSLGWL